VTESGLAILTRDQEGVIGSDFAISTIFERPFGGASSPIGQRTPAASLFTDKLLPAVPERPTTAAGGSICP
jgi:hypothetical protein